MTFKSEKNKKDGLGLWHVVLKDKEWADLIKKSRSGIINNLKIPGFRKGMIPPAIANKYVNERSVLESAARLGVKQAYEYALSQKDSLVPASQPQTVINTIANDHLDLTFKFDLSPSIVIGKYKNLSLAKTSIEVSQKEIDEQIQLLKNNFAMYEPKDKALEVGDLAVFDFMGKLDGEAFPGGSGQNMELEIGSNRFIPGFETSMVGMMPSSEKTITVTFPADYQVPNLQSKAAQFEIKLHEVKIKIASENNEDLVQDANIPNVKTYDDLLAHIEQQLSIKKEKEERERFLDELFRLIVAEADITIPASAVDKEKARLEEEFKTQLTQQNFTWEAYKKMSGLSDEEIREEISKDALSELQNYLIVQEVIRHENIKVTDDEIDNKLKELATQYNMAFADIKKAFTNTQMISDNIARTKAIDWLFENNGTSNTVGAKKSKTTKSKSDEVSEVKSESNVKKTPVKKVVKAAEDKPVPAKKKAVTSKK